MRVPAHYYSIQDWVRKAAPAINGARDAIDVLSTVVPDQPLRRTDSPAFAGLTVTGTVRTDKHLIVNGAPGAKKLTVLRTNDVTRWEYGASISPESGANSGSNFEVYRFADDGAFLGTAFSISRASGTTNFSNTITARSANATALIAQSTTGNLVNLAFQSNTGDQVRLEAVIDGPNQGSLIPKGTGASVNLGTGSNPWNAAHFAGGVTAAGAFDTSNASPDGQNWRHFQNSSGSVDFGYSFLRGGRSILTLGQQNLDRLLALKADDAGNADVLVVRSSGAATFAGSVTAGGAMIGRATTHIAFDALTGRIDQQSGGFSHDVDVGTLTGINPNYHMKSASGRTGMLWELDNDFLASDGSEAAFWAFAPFDTLSGAQRAGHHAFRATIGAAASTDVFTVDWNGTVTARQNRITIADPVTPANRSAHLITFDGAANAAEIGVRGSGAGGVLDARITFDGRVTWPHIFAADGSVQHSGAVTFGSSTVQLRTFSAPLSSGFEPLVGGVAQPDLLRFNNAEGRWEILSALTVAASVTADGLNTKSIFQELSNHIGNNLYFDGGWKFGANGYGAMMKVCDINGDFEVAVAEEDNAAGTGAPATLRQTLRFDRALSAGNGAWLFGDMAGQLYQMDRASLRPRTDNIHALGDGGFRFTQVFAATGTIQTSDARTKQDRALISDSLLDAVDGTELVTYRLRDAVAEKGDGARLHTGAVAQEFEAALTANGIDGDTIAALCRDTWTDADGGGQQDRYGLRYDQFNILLHAAVRRRLAALEDRLARLERG